MVIDAVPTMTDHIRSGKVKAFGTTGEKRPAVLPDVPTVSEAGVPGYEAVIWLGVMAPRNTPREIVQRLNAGGEHRTVAWLAWFDGWVLLAELVVITIFLLSLGEVGRVWLTWRGVALLLLVILPGILIPLVLHFRPVWVRERWRTHRIVAGAVLVLIGGFFLRFVTLLSSETIHGPHSGLQGPHVGLWP